MSDLKIEHQQFINEYFMRNMNATDAYLEVYGRQMDYFVAASAASRLLKNVKVAAEIKRRMQEKIMTADEVLIRLAEQAQNLHTQFIDDNGNVDLKKLRKAGLMHLVKGTKRNAKGDLIVEFHDNQKALDLIGKYHALWTERVKIDLPQWLIDLLPHVRNGKLDFETAVSELGESLAQELFKEAGVDYE